MTKQLLGACLFRDEKYWPGSIVHYCPACKCLHPFAIDKPFSNKAVWSFNGNTDKPTFSPSMKITSGCYIPGARNKPGDCAMCDAGGKYGACGICHYFIRDGQLIYCGDCTHEYRGKTIPLPELPDKYKL